MGGPSSFCRNCGTELRPDVRFCTSCGHTTSPGSMPSGKASEESSEGLGSAPTITSSAVTGGRPEYRPSSQFEPAHPPPPRERGVNRPRLLAIGAVVAGVAALATVVIVVLHPFGHGASPRPIAQSSSAATDTLPSGSPRPSGSSPPSASGTPSASSSPSPSGSPSPSVSSPQQAATRLAALLGKSVTDRNAV